MEGTYYQAHRETILARAKERRAENPELYRKQYKEWYELNKKDLYIRRKEKLLSKPKPVRIKPVKVKPEPVIILPVLSPPPEPVSNIEYIHRPIILSFQ